MISIIQSPFFTLLNDAITNYTAISKTELSVAFNTFREDFVLALDSVADFASAYRFIGSIQIELSTLRDGIIAPNCEAGEKCRHHHGVS